MLFRESLPDLKSSIRFLHAGAGADAIDIYSNGSPIATSLSFGKITPFQNVTPGRYDIQIFKAGTYDTPLFTDKLEIIPNAILTLGVVLLESTLTLSVLKDITPSKIPTLSFLRFINYSPDSPLLTLSLPNGDILFNGAEYLETTGFYPLSAGLYNFLMTASSDANFRKFINNVNLKENTSHTIFIIGLNEGEPKIGYLITNDTVEDIK